MSTHKNIDRICVAVLICTVLITVLFMNGSSFGLEPIKDGDAVDSTDSAYFTKNDRDGSWSTAGATQIKLDGDHASITGGGAYFYDGDVVIAQAGRYVCSGTLTDGSIRVDADSSAKVWILLDGAFINCSDDACLRVEQAKKVFLTLAEGSENSLHSGAVYSEQALADNTGGAIFARDNLTVNGSGSLSITAEYRHGIDANDDLIITGGSITIEAPQDGIHVNDDFCIENASLRIVAGDEGVSVQGEEALLCVASGSLEIESGGAAIKSASDILLLGGTLSLSSDDDGIHSAGNVTVADGDLSISVADDGIHADQAVSISGGSLLIEDCYEGIEGLTIDISGGELEIYPSDDGLNANGGSGGFGGMFMRPGQAAQSTEAESETWIHISGGSITVVNDVARDADGLDSNGDILITGGTIRVSLTASGSNNAIDYGSESGGICEINGGDVVACGSSMMAEGFSDTSTQCSIFITLGTTLSGGTEVRLLDAAGNELLRYTPPCSFSCVSLSSPAMQLGETYTVVFGDTETEITLEEVATTYSEGGSTGWGGMGQRNGNGGPGGNRRGRMGENSSESGEESDQSMRFEERTPPEMGEGRPDMGGMQPGFGGQMPPEMGEAPQDFDGEWPDPSDMPAPPEWDGEQPDFGPMLDGEQPNFGSMPEREQSRAEEATAPEAAEETDEGPQPVSAATWQLIGACALVLVLGILFAVKYRR